MSRVRQLLRSNMTASAVQQLTQILAGLGLQVYLARSFTQSEFGVVAFIGSVIAMVIFIAQMRIGPLIARQVARAPEDAAVWMGRGQAVTLLLAPLGILIPAVWVAIQDGRPAVIVATAVAGVGLFFNSMMVVADAILHGLSRLHPIAPAWIVGRLIMVVVTVAAVELGGSVIAVYGGQAIGLAVVAGMLLLAVRRHVGPWRLRVPAAEVGSLMRSSIPFAGVSLFASVYLLADVIILEYIRGEEEVAVYRVASLAVVHLPMLSMVLLRGLYPRVSALAGQPEQAGEALSFAVNLLLMLSIPMSVGGILVAEPLIVAAVGTKYAAAALPMCWLLPMVPLRMLSNATGMTMNALDLPGLRARGLAIAATANVALNLWLIPEYGATAAAATTLVADIFVVSFQAVALRRVAKGVDYIRPVVRTLPALAVMCAVLYASPSIHVFARITLGAMAYVAVLFVTGSLTRQQLVRAVRL